MTNEAVFKDYCETVDKEFSDIIPVILVNNAIKLSGVSKFQREISRDGASSVVLEVAANMAKVFNNLTKFNIEGQVYKLITVKKLKSTLKVSVTLGLLGQPTATTTPTTKGSRIG
jgi:hypothetical protein